MERLAAHELVACQRRAPAPLDVGDDPISAPGMATWILVKGIGEIAAEHRPLPPVDELADAVRATQHADVRVNSHHEGVSDLALLEKVEDLLAVVTHRVVGTDLYLRRLPSPRSW